MADGSSFVVVAVVARITLTWHTTKQPVITITGHTHIVYIYIYIVGPTIRPRDERHNNGNDNDYVMAVEIEQWKRATNDYIRLILG